MHLFYSRKLEEYLLLQCVYIYITELEIIDTFTSLMLFSWKKRVVYVALNTSLSGYSYYMNSHLLQANHHIQRPRSISYPWFHWGIPPSLSEPVCFWISTLSVVYRPQQWLLHEYNVRKKHWINLTVKIMMVSMFILIINNRNPECADQ